jgi:hypothetical protein
LPLITFSISEAQKHTLLEENIKHELPRLDYFPVSEQYTMYLGKIMKTHLKIGLKD